MKYFNKPTNKEGGSTTATLSLSETTVLYLDTVPDEAPGFITLEPDTDNEEEIYYETRDAGTNTVGGLTRDTSNRNGGVGIEHQSGSAWENRQSATYIQKIVEGLLLTLNNSTGRIKTSTLYALDSGAADAYVVAPSPVISSYVTGEVVVFKAVNANTGASTINVNGLGVKSIKKNGSSALEAGDIAAGQIVTVIYDGTNFQLIGNVYTPPVVTNDGWTSYSAVVPTRQASNDPFYTLRFTGVDVTGIFSAGARVSWIQNSIVRYGIVSSSSYGSSNTDVVILTKLRDTNANYDVLDTSTNAITALKYSYNHAPVGFPVNEANWMWYFKVYRSTNQATSAGVVTKVQFATEVEDVDGLYDSSTNYRFTPKENGWYSVTWNIKWNSISAGNDALSFLYKNGSLLTSGYSIRANTTEFTMITVSQKVYLTTSDYLEIYAQSGNASNVEGATANQNFFEVSKVAEYL